jgi:hypothetical protein
MMVHLHFALEIQYIYILIHTVHIVGAMEIQIVLLLPQLLEPTPLPLLTIMVVKPVQVQRLQIIVYQM